MYSSELCERKEVSQLDHHLNKNYKIKSEYENKKESFNQKQNFISNDLDSDFSKTKSNESTSFLNYFNLNENQQLFIDKKNNLNVTKPPFITSGVYKQLSNSNIGTQTSKNVFISKEKNSGRIITLETFKKKCLNVKIEKANNQSEKTDYSCKYNEGIKDYLKVFACKMLKLSSKDAIIIDRKSNEIILHKIDKNQKIVYRFPTKENLGLISTNHPTTVKSISKRGRPKKQNKLMKCESPLKVSKSPISTCEIQKDRQPLIRSRYGRIIKSNVKLLPQSNEHVNDSNNTIKNLMEEFKDSDYRCCKKIRKPLSPLPKSPDIQNSQSSSKTRKIPPNSICPTCNKIFLGKRLSKHYAMHPDHLKIQKDEYNTALTKNTDLSLFKFLVKKLQNNQLTEDQRTDLFLNEISDLVEQIQLRSSRLIRNTSGLHILSSRSAKVLGLPQGQYSFDISVLEEPPDTSCLLNFENIAPQATITNRSLDFNLSMSLDDTLNDTKLGLSVVNMIPSEESLLRTVDDLVTEKMKKLNDEEQTLLHDRIHNLSTEDGDIINQGKKSSTVINYEHDNDNAVEAASMKVTQPLNISLDLFQFSNN